MHANPIGAQSSFIAAPFPAPPLLFPLPNTEINYGANTKNKKMH